MGAQAEKMSHSSDIVAGDETETLGGQGEIVREGRSSPDVNAAFEDFSERCKAWGLALDGGGHDAIRSLTSDLSLQRDGASDWLMPPADSFFAAAKTFADRRSPSGRHLNNGRGDTTRSSISGRSAHAETANAAAETTSERRNKWTVGLNHGRDYKTRSSTSERSADAQTANAAAETASETHKTWSVGLNDGRDDMTRSSTSERSADAQTANVAVESTPETRKTWTVGLDDGEDDLMDFSDEEDAAQKAESEALRRNSVESPDAVPMPSDGGSLLSSVTSNRYGGLEKAVIFGRAGEIFHTDSEIIQNSFRTANEDSESQDPTATAASPIMTASGEPSFSGISQQDGLEDDSDDHLTKGTILIGPRRAPQALPSAYTDSVEQIPTFGLVRCSKCDKLDHPAAHRCEILRDHLEEGGNIFVDPRPAPYASPPSHAEPLGQTDSILVVRCGKCDKVDNPGTHRCEIRQDYLEQEGNIFTGPRVAHQALPLSRTSLPSPAPTTSVRFFCPKCLKPHHPASQCFEIPTHLKKEAAEKLYKKDAKSAAPDHPPSYSWDLPQELKEAAESLRKKERKPTAPASTKGAPLVVSDIIKDPIINLCVGERTFTARVSTLVAGSSCFERLICGGSPDESAVAAAVACAAFPWKVSHDEIESAPTYFLDVDPDAFAHVLRHLRSHVMPLFWDRARGFDYNMYEQVHVCASALGVDALAVWIKHKQYLGAVKVEHSVSIVPELEGYPGRLEQIVVRGARDCTLVPEWHVEKTYLCPRREQEHEGKLEKCGVVCEMARAGREAEYREHGVLKAVAVSSKVVFEPGMLGEKLPIPIEKLVGAPIRVHLPHRGSYKSSSGEVGGT